jgi:hypothetical protein
MKAMLRQFSARRIIFFFLLDLLGTLAMFYLAASLRVEVGKLPEGLLALLRAVGISQGTWADWTALAKSAFFVPQV